MEKNFLTYKYVFWKFHADSVSLTFKWYYSIQNAL